MSQSLTIHAEPGQSTSMSSLLTVGRSSSDESKVPQEQRPSSRNCAFFCRVIVLWWRKVTECFTDCCQSCSSLFTYCCRDCWRCCGKCMPACLTCPFKSYRSLWEQDDPQRHDYCCGMHNCLEYFCDPEMENQHPKRQEPDRKLSLVGCILPNILLLYVGALLLTMWTDKFRDASYGDHNRIVTGLLPFVGMFLAFTLFHCCCYCASCVTKGTASRKIRQHPYWAATFLLSLLLVGALVAVGASILWALHWLPEKNILAILASLGVAMAVIYAVTIAVSICVVGCVSTCKCLGCTKCCALACEEAERERLGAGQVTPRSAPPPVPAPPPTSSLA